MNDLIARLEKATGPEHGLDCVIHAALDRPDPHMPAPYTRSLDAALTLVPDGWLARGMRQPDPTLKTDCARAWVYPHQTNDDGWAVSSGEGSHAATIPLALCAACLKARALLAQGGEARRAETALAGSVHEHPVAEGDAPTPPLGEGTPHEG